MRRRARRNRASVLVHDPERNRESQSRTLADFLGREERIEQVRQQIRWDAGPRVVDLQDEQTPIRVAGDDDFAGFPVFGDRVLGIDEDVEQRLLE